MLSRQFQTLFDKQRIHFYLLGLAHIPNNTSFIVSLPGLSTNFIAILHHIEWLSLNVLVNSGERYLVV